MSKKIKVVKKHVAKVVKKNEKENDMSTFRRKYVRGCLLRKSRVKVRKNSGAGTTKPFDLEQIIGVDNGSENDNSKSEHKN